MPEIGSEAPKTPPPSESSSVEAAEASGVAPPKELRLHPDSPRHLPEDTINKILRGEDDNTPAVTTQNPEITKLGEVRKYRKALGLPLEAGDYPPMAGGNGEDEEDPGREPEETEAERFARALEMIPPASTRPSTGNPSSANIDQNDLDTPTFRRRQEGRKSQNRDDIQNEPSSEPVKPERSLTRTPDSRVEEEQREYQGLVNDEKFITDILRRFGGLSSEELKTEISKLPSATWRKAASTVLGVPIPNQLAQAQETVEEEQSEPEEIRTVGLNRRLNSDEERQVNELALNEDFIDDIEDRYGDLPTQNEQIDAINRLPELERLAAAIVLALNVSRTDEPADTESTDMGTRSDRNAGSETGDELPPAPVGGERGPGGRGPEGPPRPPEKDNLEFEASPERGREITQGIIKWEALRAAGRYKEVGWSKLNDLYRQQRVRTTAQRIVGLRVKLEELEILPQEAVRQTEKVDGEALKHLTTSSRNWHAAYTDPENLFPEEALPQFYSEMNVYFEQAKKAGLLNGLDNVLSDAFNRDILAGMRRGLSAEAIMQGDPYSRIEGVEQKILAAIRSFNATLRNRREADPEVANLFRVGELYAARASQKFYDFIAGDDIDAIPADTEYRIENEFKLGEGTSEDAPQENYWRPSQGGYYIEIYAQTPEEFSIAAESYLSRLEAVTAAPDRVFQKADQFVDIMINSEGANRVSEDFLKDLSDQIYGRLGVFGANNANELYQPEQYKQYMDFINKDAKGPKRWLELEQLLDGEVAAVLWMLDRDPRWETALFAMHGSRGQLAKASQAQRGGDGVGLHNQARALLVEEMMGVRIKNKGYVKNVTKFMPDNKFESMFDGLYRYDPNRTVYGDANIQAYEQFKDKDDRQLTPDQRRAKRLGRIQMDLMPIEKGGKGKNLTEMSKKTSSKEDQSDAKIYKEAHERAAKAVEIAFQIYGALGEKSKRGGGVFKIRKVDAEGNEYYDFVPNHFAEKFVQFAVTMTKMKYADDAEVWGREQTWNDSIAQEIRRKNKEKGDKEFKNFKAKYRTAKTEQARAKSIDEFAGEVVIKNGRPDPNGIRRGGKGFESRLYEYNDKGDRIGQMRLKRPKKDPDSEDEIARDNTGKVIVEEVPVDFHIASHHFYGDWTSHTYWSYQEEDRHMILDPETFAQARKIRAGEIRPEDADPWAIQLLIIDPTLRRVWRFEDNFEDRERKLAMAAVEDSYLTHWDISSDLYRAFFPKFGTPTNEIGIYYGLQDFGGTRKMMESMRAQLAEDPERFMRRGRRLLADLHDPVAALSEIWGQGSRGALGSLWMLNAPIYRMGGAFALDKFAAQSDVGFKIRQALVEGSDQQGGYEEGLLLKLTNNSDKLVAVIDTIPDEGNNWEDPKLQNDYCYAIIDSLGRLAKYEKLLTWMETKIRNSSGAFDLRNVDILTGGEFSEEFATKLSQLPDITVPNLKATTLTEFVTATEKLAKEHEAEFKKFFNEADIDESKSPNTGSGRHGARKFHDIFGRLLVDQAKRGGEELYPGEIQVYRRIFDKIIVPGPTQGSIVITDKTIWDFVFDKLVPT